MEEELLDRAARQADQAEVFRVSSRSTPVSFEANRLKSIETRDSSAVGIRILKGGRVGISAATGAAASEGLLSRALESLPYGPLAAMDLPGAQKYPNVPVYDEATAALPVEAMVELGRQLVDRMQQRWTDVQWDCRVSRMVATHRLINSRGCSAEYASSSFSVSIEGTLVQDTDMLFVHDAQRRCGPFTDTSPLAQTLDQRLEWARDIVPAPSGDVPVIFTPQGVAGVLLGPLLAGFSGRAILQGASPLVGRLGEQLVDPCFTISDDPTLPHVPGSRMCDDEGVASRRLPLIERGVARNFLYDLQTAGQAGARSTGSASRPPGSLPVPAPSVIVVEAGKTSFEEMLASQDDALIVESLLGAGQGNVLGGDFSANVLLGYRVSKGRVVGRVKNTVITGNAYRALRNVLALESTSHWVGGSLQTPAICSGGVSVSSN